MRTLSDAPTVHPARFQHQDAESGLATRELTGPYRSGYGSMTAIPRREQIDVCMSEDVYENKVVPFFQRLQDSEVVHGRAAMIGGAILLFQQFPAVVLMGH